MWGELAEIWGVNATNETEKTEKQTVWNAATRCIQAFDSIYAKAMKYGPLLEYAIPILLDGPK